jgi:hypothetical protein
MDIPLLLPLPLPEGHGAHDNAIANNNAIPFLVRQYFIKGVHNLLQELRSYFTMFYKELITFMEGASESWQLITKEKHMTILTVLIRIRDGDSCEVAEVNLPTNI